MHCVMVLVVSQSNISSPTYHIGTRTAKEKIVIHKIERNNYWHAMTLSSKYKVSFVVVNENSKTNL